MSDPARSSLRTKVMLRVMPLMLACCLVLWATAAWRAHLQQIDTLTETLRLRLSAKLELMQARFNAVDDALGGSAQSSIMVGALTGQDLDRVVLPHLRSISLAGARTLGAALLDYRGRPILLDDPQRWRRPALLDQVMQFVLDGRPMHWIEGDALHLVHPIYLGETVEGAMLASVAITSMFDGLDPGVSALSTASHTALAQAMLHPAPASGGVTAIDARSRFVADGEMLEGTMILPLEREPGLALIVNKKIKGLGFATNPVQQFLAAMFLFVLLLAGLGVHFAALSVTRPIGRLVDELRAKGLEIDEAAPSDANEVNDLRRRFRAAAEDVELSLLRERELNAKQRMFVSMVSHEFRTPLAIIDGSASSLQRRRARMSEEVVANKLVTIRTSVARLVRLMEGALVSSSLDSGTLRLALGSVDMRRVVDTLVDERQAISPDAEFTVDVAALSEPIRVDERLIYSLVDNLISNAVKYAHETPKVRVLGWVEGRFACISVADNGVGIPAAELPRIGERFFRASTSAGVSGTGIGVSMVAMVARLHGGDIEVASTVGEGTIFTVRLPLAGPAAHDAAGDDASDPCALWRVVYRSRAASALDGAALSSLVAHASVANAKIGVTGCLFQRNGLLAQVLEGRRSELERIVAVIRRDNRHSGFEIVATGPAESRAYPDWAMLVAPPPDGADLAEALLADIARRTDAVAAPTGAAA